MPLMFFPSRLILAFQTKSWPQDRQLPAKVDHLIWGAHVFIRDELDEISINIPFKLSELSPCLTDNRKDVVTI